MTVRRFLRLGRILREVSEKLGSNPTARIYTFRALLISSLILLILICSSRTARFTVIYFSSTSLLAVPPIVIMHHLASIFKWRFFYEIFDWLLVTSETVVCTWFPLSKLASLGSLREDIDVVFRAANYAQGVALLCVWILRTAAIIASRGRNIFLPFTFLPGCNTQEQSYSPQSIIFGRSLCQSSSRGESFVIKLLRALFAISFITLLSIFGCYSMILDPLRDTGPVPFKTYHVANNRSCGDTNTNPVLSILAAVPYEYIMTGSPYEHTYNFENSVPYGKLNAAVNVTSMADPAAPSHALCESTGDYLQFQKSGRVYYRPNMGNYLIRIPCTFLPNARSRYLISYEACLTRLSFSELFITVNFTALGIPSDSPMSIRERAVSIFVGLTNDTADIISETRPTPLGPGYHLIGSISPRFRRRLNKNAMAAFGAFNSWTTFVVSDIVGLVPDPSPPVPHLENTATLRLYYQEDLSNWVVNEDYREKSILSGFSAFGGFWTFVNGTFALVFGSSLVLTLFGIKPLSVFGLVHFFQPNRLRNAWYAAFPQIRTEGGAPGSEQAGLVAFLRERLVDLDAIGDEGDDIESQFRSLVITNEPPVHRDNAELVDLSTTPDNPERMRGLAAAHDGMESESGLGDSLQMQPVNEPNVQA